MTEADKVYLYDKQKQIIHPLIKADARTKPLWRKLFWTTGKDSDEYKAGCIDIFKDNFPSKYQDLISLKKNY